MSFSRKHTEEEKTKISQSLMGRKTWNKGLKMPEETKQKISQSLKNRIIKQETKEKLSLLHKGKPKTQQHKQKISENHHDVKLEKNPMWKGGKSFEKYTLQWTKELREKIRKRDNFVCKICGITQNERKMEVHHIDYDKQNCDEKNLITLCLNCHRKTNSHREYWKEWFDENNS
jgi:hypothetical protein